MTEVLQTLYALFDEVRALRERIDLVIASMEIVPAENTAAEQLAEFNRQAQLHADRNGLTFDEGAQQLANLLTNMLEHPIETELFFLKLRASYREGSNR